MVTEHGTPRRSLRRRVPKPKLDAEGFAEARRGRFSERECLDCRLARRR
jgi:hypothetical protein